MTSFPVDRSPPFRVEIARRQRVVAALCGPIALVLAPVALGLALQVNFGQYHPLALRWLTVSMLACFAGYRSLCREQPPAASDADSRVLTWALGIGLVVQFGLLLTRSPMATLVVRSPRDLLPFQIGVAVAAVFVAKALVGRRYHHWTLFGLLATHFLLGLWVLRVMPAPPVDVCVFQHDACQALLRGHNPYAMTFAVPYDDPARVYGAGTFSGGRLLFGYPYPPLSLLLVLPGYLLGDFRYAHLVAMTLAGLLIALARPGRIATAAAALFLFTPRGFFVLEAGWTEPLAVLLLAWVVFAACRSRRSLPAALGLLLVVKQYLVLAVPLVLLFKPEPGRRVRSFLRAAASLPLLLSVPLVLWNVPAFMHSAVLLQFHQPMRMDALSYAPWFIMNTRLHLPTWLPFVIGAGAIVFILRSRAGIPPRSVGFALADAVRGPCVIRPGVVKTIPENASAKADPTKYGLIPPHPERQPMRTPAAFAAGVALVFLLFFAFNKQAFCNYYFFVIGAMCCALATWSGSLAPVRRGEGADDASPSNRPDF